MNYMYRLILRKLDFKAMRKFFEPPLRFESTLNKRTFLTSPQSDASLHTAYQKTYEVKQTT